MIVFIFFTDNVWVGEFKAIELNGYLDSAGMSALCDSSWNSLIRFSKDFPGLVTAMGVKGFISVRVDTQESVLSWSWPAFTCTFVNAINQLRKFVFGISYSINSTILRNKFNYRFYLLSKPIVHYAVKNDSHNRNHEISGALLTDVKM